MRRMDIVTVRDGERVSECVCQVSALQHVDPRGQCIPGFESWFY